MDQSKAAACCLEPECAKAIRKMIDNKLGGGGERQNIQSMMDDFYEKAKEIYERLEKEYERYEKAVNDIARTRRLLEKIVNGFETAGRIAINIAKIAALVGAGILVGGLIGGPLGAVLGGGFGLLLGASPFINAYLWKKMGLFENGGPIYGPSHAQGGVLAELEGGEHVWSRRDVAAAGGHAAVESLRKGGIDGNYTIGALRRHQNMTRQAHYLGLTG